VVGGRAGDPLPGPAVGVWCLAGRPRPPGEVELPSWPVYGLEPDTAAEPGFLRWSEADRSGSSRRVILSYGAPAANEQWEVSSEPLYGDAIESLDYWVAAMYLRDRVEYPVAGALPAPGGAGVLPEAPRAKPDDVVVDDVSVSGVVQRMGDYTAWRVVSENVVVTVTKRNASSPAPRIAAIRDLAPYVQRRAAGMTAWTKPYRDRPPSKPLTGPNATQPLWAHESFVAMVMTRSEELDHATALHRTPPVTDPDWLRRREAAIRRQQELRRQDHSTARAAVSRMVEEIMDLQQASWWSDEHRRKQAITRIIRETAYGTHRGAPQHLGNTMRRARLGLLVAFAATARFARHRQRHARTPMR